MPLKIDPLLINLQDFSNFRDISMNTDADRLNAQIRESQMREIRAFLGDELYYSLISDYTVVPDAEGTFATPRFDNLWYGAEYVRNGITVNFNGLKPAHIYYSYERFIYQNKLNVTRYGNRVLSDNDLSEDLNTKKYEIQSDSMGLLYQSDTKLYIDSNASVYPEFRNPLPRRQEEKTGLKMFKVGHKRGR